MSKIPHVKGFTDSKTIEERLYLAGKLMANNRDHVPVVVVGNGINAPIITKQKYICPVSVTGDGFRKDIRDHMEALDSTGALFYFVDNALLPMNKTMGEIYDRYKSNDGFLYVIYSVENTFG